MRYIVENSPCFNVLSFNLDKVIVDGMEHQRKRLQEHQHCHDVVDLVNRMCTLFQDKDPEETTQEEQERHHKVKGW